MRSAGTSRTCPTSRRSTGRPAPNRRSARGSQGDQEIFSTQEMIDLFDLPAIGRSAARFDFAKLENLNGHYIRNSDDETLTAAFEDVLNYIEAGDAIKAKLNPATRAQLLQAMPGLKERAKTLVELVDSAG